MWLAPGRFYCPGELRVAGGRVVGLGPARGGRVPARAIFPGLVNAHVHLQLPPLPRPRRQFLAWVGAVMAERAASDAATHVARADAALRRLAADGVCAVGEIDSTGLSPAVLRRVAVGGVCYQEVTGFHLHRRGAAELIRSRTTPGSRHCRGGLSPHAPYSVSSELFRAARTSGLPLAVHVAETEEELRFLRTGDGPFRELLEALGRLPDDFRPPGTGVIAWLDRLGILGPGTALIHAHLLDRDEARTVARRGAPIVVCPGTIRYFRREPPPVPEWLAMGIPVALGTDSLASNTELSLRGEMALARRMWPELAPDTVLAMATCHGGTALGRAGLGRLRRGAPANFVEFPMNDGCSDCLDALTAGELRPSRVWLRGSSLEAAGIST